VPFVPTPVFSTPIPTARRGGRGPRGGREGGTRGGNTTNGANGTERPPIATATIPRGQALASGGNEREGAVLSSTTTNASLQKPKRASSAGPTTPMEQRRTRDGAMPEKRKDIDNGSLKASEDGGSIVHENQGPSAPLLIKDSQTSHPANAQANEPARHSTDLVQNKTEEHVKYPNGTMDPRMNGSERRSEGSIKSPDHIRDVQGHFPLRERGEGRSERGRGVYRGRGGANHTYFNSNTPNGHGYANGHASQYQHPSAPPSNLRSNHDRLPSQPQGSYQPPSQHTKHYRTSSRSQSIPYQSPPHTAPYRGFSSGHHGQASHLPNLQTDIANEYGYQPGHQGIMSAMPYDPLEQANTWSMVQMQM
jgi:la-related protein 1